MSVEDDIDSAEMELKELVTQTLEENGLLAKIRAQLRAGLYVALENEINESNNQSHIGTSLKTSLARADIRTVFCLVREFLEYYELDFTNSVFEKESFMGILYDYKGKERLIKDLEIGIDKVSQTPLLVELLNIARSNYKYSTKINGNDSVQNMSYMNDSKELNNATYEVPSNQINKLPSVNELDSLKNTPSEISDDKSNMDIKIVPKSNLNETNDSSISSIDSKSSSKEKKLEDSKSATIVKSDEKWEPTKVQEEPHKFETDDTYEGTSSIAEDSVSNNKDAPLIDLDKTGKIVTAINPVPSVKCLIDQTIDESPPNKSPRLSLDSSEKKKHDKAEKPKPMSGLSSLADLPPLQVTKTRSPDTVLLPSLYSKEFRDRSNLKDIDKLLDLNFDSIDNYEEDFILSAGIDYERNKNINSVLSKNDHNKSESSKHFTPIKLFDGENKTVNKNTDTKKNVDRSGSSTNDRENNGNDIVSSNSNKSDHKKDGETTSISEDLDFNSNSDDVLKSDNT